LPTKKAKPCVPRPATSPCFAAATQAARFCFREPRPHRCTADAGGEAHERRHTSDASIGGIAGHSLPPRRAEARHGHSTELYDVTGLTPTPHAQRERSTPISSPRGSFSTTRLSSPSPRLA
jgi:hypothetical protein